MLVVAASSIALWSPLGSDAVDTRLRIKNATGGLLHVSAVLFERQDVFPLRGIHW